MSFFSDTLGLAVDAQIIAVVQALNAKGYSEATNPNSTGA